MIPKAQLPFLKPLKEQIKRRMMVKKKRKTSYIKPQKRYSSPSLTSRTQLKNQVKRFITNES